MKRQVQQTGIRKYFGADLVELQGEPLKVLDSLFSEYGPCVVQGCEPSAAEDGTYDIAPGLVALAAADPDGKERVMAMPFGGARGVSLPVWLVAEDTVQERVYGDGKVKPVAHSYSAVVTASAPAGGVSSLQITAQGAPRLVDVLQDAAHRFVSDADKAKWDARVSTAQLAEALAAKADISGDMITVNGGTDSIPYSLPHIVKMLVAGVQYASVLNMPDGRDSSNQLKIVGQPNQEDIAFRTQEQGQWRSLWHSGNFDPAAKVDRTGGSINGVLSFGNAGAAGFAPQGETQPKFQLYAWDQLLQLTRRGANGDYMDSVFNVSYETGTVDFVNNPTVGGHPVWHSGNFDPASVFKNFTEIDSTNLNDVSVARSGNGVRRVGFYGQHSGMLVSFDPGNCSAAPLQILLDNYRNTSLKWRGGLNSVQADGPFRTIWDSGNLVPASAAADGLMTAADKRKLDATPRIIWGSVDSYGNYLSGKGFYARGLSGDYIKIEHTLGTVKYALTATVVAYGNNTYRDNYVSVMEKNTDYCLLAVLNGNGNTIERAVVDFQIVY